MRQFPEFITIILGETPSYQVELAAFPNISIFNYKSGLLVISCNDVLLMELVQTVVKDEMLFGSFLKYQPVYET